MGLNTAGIDALLDDGNEAVVWVAVGNGQTSGDQTSNERLQATLGAPAGGVITVSNVPLQFTGAAAAGATNALFFSASTAGTFYGFKALTGDQAFNAAGDYQIDTLTITGSSPE